jgi:hypothetical protein
VCTADFDGAAQGTCLPIGCKLCAQGTTCNFGVAEDGTCTGGTCE